MSRIPRKCYLSINAERLDEWRRDLKSAIHMSIIIASSYSFVVRAHCTMLALRSASSMSVKRRASLVDLGGKLR